MDCLSKAIEYAGLGQSVFPLHGKAPIKGSRGLLDATRDADAIRSMWRPDANVGIATGDPSGVWVLDIDPEHGGEDSLLALQVAHDDLPETLTVRTGGGGRHFYWLMPSGVEVRNRAGLGDDGGIDVRGTGGYVVAPPSIHPDTGARYEWTGGRPVLAPQWLLDWVRHRPEREAGERVRADVQTVEGARNHTLFKLGCSLRAQGFDQHLIASALDDVNDRHCDPPLPKDEVDTLAANICRQYAPGDVIEMLERRQRRAEREAELDEWVAERPPLQSKTHECMARELHHQMTDMCEGVPPVYDRERLWWYRGAVWEVMTSRAAARVVQQWEGRPVEYTTNDGEVSDKPLRLNQNHVAGTVEHLRNIVESPGYFDAQPRGVVVGNGFVRVRGGQVDLLPHAPDHRATHQAPVEWHAGAVAPMWMAFLQSCFDGCADGADRIALVQEFFGATICGLATSFQRCLLLHGPGGNGKSQVIGVLTGLLPAKTVSHVPPHKMGEEYWVSRLATSWLNAHADLPSKQVAAGPFKEIVAGDPMSARDPRGLVYDFVPRAAHIFSTNSLPSTGDNSAGFWERILLVEMPHSFRGKKGQIRDIAEVLLRDEADAIFAWAVEGARRLIANGKYTTPASMVETLTEWRETADRVTAFIRERCTPCPRMHGERVSDLRREFCAWDKEQGGGGRMTELTFTTKLKQAGFTPKKCRGVRAKTTIKVNLPMADPYQWGDVMAEIDIAEGSN